MPFRSEAQRRYLWKFHPDIAKRWAHETGAKNSRKEGLPLKLKKKAVKVKAGVKKRVAKKGK